MTVAEDLNQEEQLDCMSPRTLESVKSIQGVSGVVNLENHLEIDEDDSLASAGAEAQDGFEDSESGFVGWDEQQKTALIEALLYAHGAPLGVTELHEITGLQKESVEGLLEILEARCKEDVSGVDLVRVGGKFQLRTKTAFAPFVSKLRAERPKRLSRPALETLAIVAYRQPLTRGDIEKIRGVDCTPTLKTLMERGMIKIVGYSSAVGQPALYATTEEFLHVFGLSGLPELPALRDINLFEEDPGETSDERFPPREDQEKTDEAEAVIS